MRFLVDAHLPRRMVAWLNNAGCDALHTLDLPAGNRSTDEQIIEFAELEQLVVPLIASLVVEFQTHAFLELGRAGLLVRG